MLVVICASIAGCGKNEPVPESQVAARVNRSDISIHQVQAVLSRQPRLVATAGETSAARVLEALIDQELAAQAARDQGLERDPNVIQSLQATQREVLARAHQERIAANAPGVTSDEIDRYFDSKPALFAQRRLYILQETAVGASEAQLDPLREIAARSQSAEELLRAIRSAGLRPTTRQLAQAAEDLPLALLEPLAKLTIGQSILFPQPGGARIFTVLHAQSAPVDRRAAAPAIENFLLAERKRQLVADEIKRLRQAATITYQGAFAASAASAPAGAAPATAPR